MATIGLAALIGGFMITSCNTESKKESQEKKENLDIKKEITTPVKKVQELKLAFVDMDTISSQYQFNKDAEALLKKQESSSQTTLKNKQQALQNKYTQLQQELQNKVQNNKFSSQEEFEKAQAAASAQLEKMQQELQETEAKLTNAYQEAFVEQTKAINDTIEHFLQLYGEEKGYDMILGKSKGTGSVLYSKDAFDVTEEVITALNKRYAMYKNKKKN